MNKSFRGSWFILHLQFGLNLVAVVIFPAQGLFGLVINVMFYWFISERDFTQVAEFGGNIQFHINDESLLFYMRLYIC